jgi:hypothetical protein
MNYYNNYHHQQQLSLVDTMNQNIAVANTRQQLVAHFELDSIITNLHLDKSHWREQASQLKAKNLELEKELKISKEESKISMDACRLEETSQDSQPVSWWASAWLLWAWMWWIGNLVLWWIGCLVLLWIGFLVVKEATLTLINNNTTGEVIKIEDDSDVDDEEEEIGVEEDNDEEDDIDNNYDNDEETTMLTTATFVYNFD